MIRIASRLERQRQVFEWGRLAFGEDQMRSQAQRGLRLVEEAIEVAQAAECDPAALHRLIDYVYARPVGDVEAELGGVQVCVLAMAECVGASAEECEHVEIARILEKPISHFTQRNQAKNDAGFLAKGIKT